MRISESAKWPDVLRWVLGGLFLWAAVSKLGNPTQFLSSIYAYDLPLPRSWLQAAAIVLPWLELLCGLLLITNTWPETGLLACMLMLALFLVSTGQAWARGIDISCGCFNLKIFGLEKSHPGLVQFVESVAFAFLRNLVLTACAYVLVSRRWMELRLTPASNPPQQPKTPVPTIIQTKNHQTRAQRRANQRRADAMR